MPFNSMMQNDQYIGGFFVLIVLFCFVLFCFFVFVFMFVCLFVWLFFYHLQMHKCCEVKKIEAQHG